jgi:hypothetical protein
MIDGNFESDFSALQRLRTGDTEGAIRRIEAHAFMDATLLLYDRHAEHKALDIFIPQLVDYRHSYRGSPSDWSPMEQNLERLLASRK